MAGRHRYGFEDVLLVMLVLLVAIFAAHMFDGYTGFVTQETYTTNTQALDVQLNGSGTLGFSLDDNPHGMNVTSLKLSGRVDGEGDAVLYLVDGENRYLIFENMCAVDINATPVQVPEDFPPAETREDRDIITVLEYDDGMLWDTDNDGVEPKADGVVDLTVANSAFNWGVDESKLCTKYEIESLDTGDTETVCYGARDCCVILVDREPEPGKWDESVYIFHGKWGATEHNMVEARVIFLNQSIGNETYFESVVGSPASMPVRFVNGEDGRFTDACLDTCSMSPGLNITQAVLEYDIAEGVSVMLEEVEYIVRETVEEAVVAEPKPEKVKRDSFDGETTDFDGLADLTAVSEPKLEKKGKGKVKWLGTGLDVSGADFDKHVKFGKGWVKVDGKKLNKDLDSPAEITLVDLPYSEMPLVLADGVVCSECEVLSYADGELVFEVPHFTNYSAGVNANMTIWDQNDTSEPHIPYAGLNAIGNRSIWFYANYSNISSDLAIPDAECNITFDDSVSSVMSYNATKELYEYNRTFGSIGLFYYEVNCSVVNAEMLNVTDNITIVANTAPQALNVELNSTYGTNYTTENLTLYWDVSDADADHVYNVTNWYMNGTSIAVLNMPFEGTGGNESVWAKDYTNFSNHGTVTNAVWNSDGGYDGWGAYEFDGSSTYLDVDESIIKTLSEGSISFWSKGTSTNNGQV
ncbi:hypothetical protein KY362_04525, partial [Candidatus Woesearchaeota archaeon]|nr:hypothetical protein [Candidatus Woesearchaeota archaeon]